MTKYQDYMNRHHKPWCEYPSRHCICSVPKDPTPTEDFEVNLLVSIRGYGLTELHAPDIIAKVNREMHLAFGGNVARVTEVHQDPDHESEVWAPTHQMESTQVHSVDEGKEVPRVQGNGKTAAGA
jgi:hypothetical protein